MEEQMVVDDRRRSSTQRVPQPTPSQCASLPDPAALFVFKTKTDYWVEKAERRKKKEADKFAARLELERLKEELDSVKRINQQVQPIGTNPLVPSSSAVAVAVPEAVCQIPTDTPIATTSLSSPGHSTRGLPSDETPVAMNNEMPDAQVVEDYP